MAKASDSRRTPGTEIDEAVRQTYATLAEQAERREPAQRAFADLLRALEERLREMEVGDGPASRRDP